MSLLQEAALDRLWVRYEKAFGAPPPIQTATIDETIAYLRDALGPGHGAGRSGTPRPFLRTAMQQKDIRDDSQPL